LNDFAATATRWAVRIMLMLVGLVFFLCLMAVACLIALAWGVRALWARLTGQPVVPMSMGAMSPLPAGRRCTAREPSGWRNRRAMPMPKGWA
jgi:hypothetical protein